MNNGQGIIAYRGEVTLEKAVHDNVWGMYIQLKLEQRPHEKNTANPFKKFTKMRKGRVGTRFGAVFTCADASVFYQDEVMLKSWGDGTTGWTLHLWVNPDDDGFHPWMNVDNKSMFAIAMVELDDDNSAIDQEKRERLEKAPKARQDMRLSNYAAMLCREPNFHEYIIQKTDAGGSMQAQHPENRHQVAAAWMRENLGIESRSELDTDAFAVARFHDSIRRPYAEWNSQRQ